jgi:iron complex transport system substrate-binding protein
MTRWWAPLLLALACELAFGAPVTVRDDRGVDVTLRQAPRRIVTLLPSLTETVCELSACDRLVGIDDFSNWPARVTKLPRLGGVADASTERIVALQPDLVLLSSTSRVLPRLEALGIPVLGLDMKTLADVRRVALVVGTALQLPGAPALWQRIEAGIEAAARSVPASARGTTVYFEVSDGYAASPSSHIGELLARLGASNIVPGGLGSVPKLNPEFVVRADPQLIMASGHDLSSLSTRPGWSRLHALRQGRVCAFTPAQDDVVVRPGPRVDEGAQVLADCLAGRLPKRP